MNLADNIRQIYAENGQRVALLNADFRETGTEEFVQIDDLSPGSDSSESTLYSWSVRRGSVAEDTDIAISALLNFDGRNWFVIDKAPMVHQDALYEYSLLMFTVNISGRLIRLTTQRDPKTYQTVVTETVLSEKAYGFIDIPGLTYLKRGSGITVSLDTILYLPEKFGAEPGDRFIVSETEKYQIKTVKKRIVEGLTINTITDDFRTNVSTPN